MWCIEILQRVFAHDTRRIDGPMTFVVVPLDVLEIHRGRDAWLLIDVTRAGGKIRIVGNGIASGDRVALQSHLRRWGWWHRPA